MEYFTRELCEILFDLTALLVCMFIVLFITISRFKNRHKISGIEQQKQTGNFNEAVLAQLIKQQFDKSLADTVDVINNGKLLNDNIAQGPEIVDSPAHDQPESDNLKKIDEYSDAAGADTVDVINNGKLLNDNIAQEPEIVDSPAHDQPESDNFKKIDEYSDAAGADTVDVINNGKLLNNNIAQEAEIVDSPAHDQPESDNFKMIDKYSEAAWLAKSGLNVYAIADKVKLPQGEIELIVNLHKLRNESPLEAKNAYA